MCWSSKKGFTLIEILVAIALLVIVIGAIYGAFRAGNQSSVLVEESADLNQTARILLGRMNSELCSIYKRSTQQSDFLRGENAEESGGSENCDKLSFTTVSHQPCTKEGVRSDVCAVKYSIEYDDDKRPVGLFITEDYTPDLHTDTQTTDTENPLLLSNLVIGMNCTYLDPDTDEWVDQWEDKTTLPTAVRIELILKSQRKKSHPVAVAMTTNLPSLSSTTTTSGGSSTNAQ